MLCPAMLEDIDYQYYVLPALLAVLVLGCFFVLVTSGGGEQNRPTRENSSLQAQPPTSSSARTETKIVIAKDADTAASIAASAGISVARLLKLNPSLHARPLRTGQRLKLPR